MKWDRSKQKKKRRALVWEEDKRIREWHRWFAWYPVAVPWGSGNWMWLQTIEQQYYLTVTYSDTGGFFGGSSCVVLRGWRYREAKIEHN